MRGLLIKNTPEKVSVAAYNYYGADFKLNIFNQSNNTFIAQNLAMVEGIEPVSTKTSTVSSASKGQEMIVFGDASIFAKNERISVGNYVYRITEINGNNVTLHRALMEDLDGSETINNVGNMGVYSLDLTVSELGTFLVQAKDSVYGIQHSDSIKVQDKSIRELIGGLTTDIEEVQAQVTSKQGYVMMI